MLLDTVSKGQVCTFEGDVVIEDLDTTSISIFVSGAGNDDLSSNNCLEAVTLHFKHEFVGDLVMELVSPSGQVVTLVGPSDIITANTGLVFGWNIQFFASYLQAAPDAGYDSTWNNLQTWLGLTTYSGKYYPHMGQLEDFNMGPVNGVWTLNIMDEVQFGDGNIYCFGLSFCEEDDITTTTCELVQHTFENVSLEACQGDSELDISIDPEFDQNYNEDNYEYGYLLFKEDQFQGFLSDQNLTSYESGSYTLCGILYSSAEEFLLDDLPINGTRSDIETYIMETDFCANLSQDCINVTIHPNPVMVTEVTTICFGDVVVINGVEYTETGEYEIVTSQLPCDSISTLDLTVLNLELVTIAENQSLSCANPTTFLDGSMSNIPSNANVLWQTENGNIISKVDSTIIEIDRPGTYTFEVEVNGCLYEEEITIEEEEDFVTIEANINVLTCVLDTTFIDITISDAVDTLFWTSENEFSVFNDDIRVGSAGIYTVTFITNLGCEVTRDFEVIDERVFSEVSIIGDVLTCTQGEVTLFTTPGDTLGSTFRWFNEGGDLTSDTFLLVDQPGLYSLELVTELGCSSTFEYEVLSEIEIITAELVSDTIDCNNSAVTIAYISEFEDLNVIWELPDEELVIDSAFNSSQIGTYNLSLSDDKGCILDTSLIVVRDVEIPEVSILNASFFCGDDSIQLSAQVNFDDLSYKWTRPDGSMDFSESPFIFSPGLYVLEACRPNGCCVSDSIIVGVDNDLPNISFDFDELNCNNDTVYIIPSDTTSYAMEWKLNDVDFNTEIDIIEVIEPGLYEVVVTDETNGCRSTYSFDITSNFTDTIGTLMAEPLDCANLQTLIQFASEVPVESFNWSGPSVVDNSLFALVDFEGEYFFDFILENGCSGRDSIIILQEGDPPLLQSMDQVITCNEDEVTLSVEYSSVDVSVVWTGPNNFEQIGTSVQASIPGIYTAIGIGGGSCKDTVEVKLVADTIPPVISLSVDGQLTCADSVVMVTAVVDASTESYELLGVDVTDPQDLIFEVMTPGPYVLVATGFNGCTAGTSVTVQQSTEFPDYTIDLDSITCAENLVNVGFNSSDPDLSVLWDGPIPIADDSYTFSTDLAGSYSFIISNSNGCTIEDSFMVVMDTIPPSSGILLSSQIDCVTDMVTLSVENFNPQLIVNWEGPGVTDPSVAEFTTGEVGLYTLTIEASNGCTSVAEQLVVYDTLSPEIMIVGDPITCSAGKTFLRVNSDVTLELYEWTGPLEFESTAAEPLIFAEGIYSVTVTSENGCISTDTILVEDERVFPEIEIGDFYLPCDDSGKKVFTSMLSAGSIVRWFGPNDFFAESDTALVFEEGEYIGIAINEEGCTKSDTFQVIDEPIYPEFSGTAEILLCLGPVPLMAIDVDDDRSLLWRGPNQYTSNDNPALTEEPGIYQLIVTGANGCIDSMEIEVIDGRIYPEVIANIDGPFQCENTKVFLSGVGSSEGAIYTTQWTTEDGNILQGANTLKPIINKVGTYVLEITDTQIGCVSYDTLLVQEEEQSFQGVELEIIEPTCLDFGNAEINLIQTIGGFAPYMVSVDGFDYGERTNIQYLSSGEHLLSLIDSLGCQYDTLVMIPDDNVLIVELPSDTTMCLGDTYDIQPFINIGADSIASILWSSNVPCDTCRDVQITLSEDITVSLQVIDINGCIVEDEMKIKVDRPNNLPFPQIFSPNGDDVNDIFYLPMTKGIAAINYMKIYDNWGGLLYNKTNLTPGESTDGWNGTVNGSNAEIGVYIVEALVVLEDGTAVTYVGDLTLIR
ncbi:MAG: gliding motility-associated C-terminal domain-containing protein [Bacteroidota bacterium]